MRDYMKEDFGNSIGLCLERLKAELSDAHIK